MTASDRVPRSTAEDRRWRRHIMMLGKRADMLFLLLISGSRHAIVCMYTTLVNDALPKWSRWYSCVLRIDCFLPWISFGLCLLHVFRCHASPLVAWPLVAWYILIWFETCHGHQLLIFPNVLIAQYVLLDQAERPFVTSSYATSWALTTHWWPSYSLCCLLYFFLQICLVGEVIPRKYSKSSCTWCRCSRRSWDDNEGQQLERRWLQVDTFSLNESLSSSIIRRCVFN